MGIVGHSISRIITLQYSCSGLFVSLGFGRKKKVRRLGNTSICTWKPGWAESLQVPSCFPPPRRLAELTTLIFCDVYAKASSGVA